MSTFQHVIEKYYILSVNKVIYAACSAKKLFVAITIAAAVFCLLRQREIQE